MLLYAPHHITTGTAGVLIKNKRQRDQQLLEAKLGLEAEEPLLGMMPEQHTANGAAGLSEEGGTERCNC